MPKPPAWLSDLLVTLAGMVLTAALGWYLLTFGSGRGLVRLSYDLPFIYRKHAPPEVCIIYMTEGAGRTLHQLQAVWGRSIHAQLIRRLTVDEPKAIFFDLVFSEESMEPAADLAFAEALRASGKVYLAAQMDVGTDDREAATVNQERIFPPLPMFRKVAAGWGLVALRPLDEDYGVRYLYCGTDQVPIAAWRLAKKLGATLPDDPAGRAQPRWLNYYGPVDCFQHFTYDAALDISAVPLGFFKDKIVVIGGRSSLGTLNLGKDEFRHPLTRWKHPVRRAHIYVPGAEIQATIISNLLRGDWLNRMAENHESLLVIFLGALTTLILSRLTPGYAALCAGLISFSVFAAGVWLFSEHRLWFAWAIPALAQTPVALTWAIGSRYFLIDRRRAAFRRAFARYVSPHLAEQIANSELSLEPGGIVVEATLLFTDLEGFTTMSEQLDDPTRLAELLTDYFTRTTTHVFETDGTVLKFIGDAVFAVWGAPAADPRHAAKAALAACRMHAASQFEVHGRKLRTRIGVHTGAVLAGNLGSIHHFDYTCIGDAVNIAARLEGLNKTLGTNILISETTLEQLGADAQAFVTRPLGEFRLAGKQAPICIHELIGERAQAGASLWIESFAEALAAYHDGDLSTAAAHFERVGKERGEPDGPSQFYLRQIAEPREVTPGLEWDRVVEITTK